MSSYKEHPEVTQKSRVQYYTVPEPCYDLYPGLSRKLGNGYIKVYDPKSTNPEKQTSTLKGITRIRGLDHGENLPWELQQSQQDESCSQWDLYPGVLRNVENFGTDQMRQRLIRMKSTVTSG